MFDIAIIIVVVGWLLVFVGLGAFMILFTADRWRKKYKSAGAMILFTMALIGSLCMFFFTLGIQYAQVSI